MDISYRIADLQGGNYHILPEYVRIQSSEGLKDPTALLEYAYCCRIGDGLLTYAYAH